MTKNKAILSLFIMTILWGLGFPAVQIGLNAGLTSSFLVFAKGTVALVCCLIFFLKQIKTITKKEFVICVAIGVVCWMGNVFQTIGIQLTTPAKSAFLTVTDVIMVPFIAWIFCKEKPSFIMFVSVPLCVVGMALLTGVFNEKSDFSLGDVFTILGALCYGIMVVILAHPAKSVHYQKTAFGIALVMSVGSACTLPFSENIYITNIGMALFSILFTGIVIMFISLSIQAHAQKYVSPNLAVLIMTLQSIFGTIFSVLMGFEKLQLGFIIGGVLILASIFIYVGGNKKRMMPVNK